MHTDRCDLWPPWGWSKINFKNLKKLEWFHIMKRNNKTPREQRNSEKAKLWNALMFIICLQFFFFQTLAFTYNGEEKLACWEDLRLLHRHEAENGSHLSSLKKSSVNPSAIEKQKVVQVNLKSCFIMSVAMFLIRTSFLFLFHFYKYYWFNWKIILTVTFFSCFSIQ